MVPIRPHRTPDMCSKLAGSQWVGLRMSLTLAVSLVVASCGNNAPDDDIGRGGMELERAASERGLFGGEWAEPVGIFERRNGEGRDRMCVTAMPRAAAQSEQAGPWRFAMELRTKGGGSCLTGGTLQPAEKEQGEEDKGAADHESGEGALRLWSLRFQGLEDCAVTATEQADQLILPAHMPASCSALCAGRVDLAGAELDRTSWSQDEAVILRLRRADGRMDMACAI